VEKEIKLQAVGDKLLEGVAPEELVRRHEAAGALLHLPRLLGSTGLVVGFEARATPSPRQLLRRLPQVMSGKSGVRELAGPHVQLTVILPRASVHPEAAGLLKWLGAEDGGRTVRVGGRTCRIFKGEAPDWHSAWWMEGRHLVMVASPRDPVPAIKGVLGAGAGLTSHPLYISGRRFKDFEVTTRGFLDGQSLSAGLRGLLRRDPVLAAVLEESGLLDVRSVTFWEGFEGLESRSVQEVKIAPRRRGLASFLVPKAIDLKGLPPLPADAVRWTAARTNPAAAYDLLLTVSALSDGQKPSADARRKLRQEIDEALGVKLDEVFGALGDTVLAYAAPGDGLLALGQVVAVSVKDERKLTRGLDALARKLADLTGGKGRLRKRPFHGVLIRELVIPGAPVTVSYTVHKGWLVLAAQPQPIQGFVLRSKGKLPAWKPDARTARALARVPPEAGLVQVVDPRPTVQLVLSGAPALAGLVTPRGEGRRLVEPGDLPHAGAVTKHLFPNVSWTSFDGTTFRIESRESLWLPLQEVGLEWLMLFFAA
jgi:hypothetical protein